MFSYTPLPLVACMVVAEQLYLLLYCCERMDSSNGTSCPVVAKHNTDINITAFWAVVSLK
jgi:hypothetical protein